MLIATTEVIAGGRTVTTIGLVIGLAIRSRGIGGNIMAGLHSLGNGGAMSEFSDALTTVREEAVAQMEVHAQVLGANAIVGVRFTVAEAGHDMSEVVAYGTAVVIAQDP